MIDQQIIRERAWEAEEGGRQRTEIILMGDSIRRDLERTGINSPERENGATTTNVNIPCQHVPDIC